MSDSLVLLLEQRIPTHLISYISVSITAMPKYLHAQIASNLVAAPRPKPVTTFPVANLNPCLACVANFANFDACQLWALARVIVTILSSPEGKQSANRTHQSTTSFITGDDHTCQRSRASINLPHPGPLVADRRPPLPLAITDPRSPWLRREMILEFHSAR